MGDVSSYLSRLKRLAEEAGSSWCWGFDSCPLSGGRGALVASIDGYSDEESLLPWMTLSDWGWKASVAAASDVAASGGTVTDILYSVGVRNLLEALEVARGVREAARWMGAKVGKSDVNRAGRSGRWIDVAVVGEAPRYILSRSSAEPGNLVIQAGYVGYGAVASLALQGRIPLEAVPGPIVEYTRRPRPPLKVGPAASRCGVKAAADNSDGWAFTLLLIAEESGVRIEIDRIEAPPQVVETLSRWGNEVHSLLLSSWEDYNLAIIAGKKEAKCLLEECSALGVPCRVVGKVRDGQPAVYFKGERVEGEWWESI